MPAASMSVIVHTGPYAHAFHEHDQEQEHPDIKTQLDKVCRAGELIHGKGMYFNAGHGLTICNVGSVAALPWLHELHIGHSIISRSIFTGLRTAVADMKKVITQAAVQGATLDA